jgi:hypothetical protein
MAPAGGGEVRVREEAGEERTEGRETNDGRAELKFQRENCKKPLHLGLGFQKTTTFQKSFKKPPVYLLTVTRSTNCIF